MFHGIDVYTPFDPVAVAESNSAVASALQIPKLIDNRLIAENAISVSMADIPAKVFFECPGIRYVTHIGLEHEETAESGNLRSLYKFANGLTNAADGIMLDLTTGSTVRGNEASAYDIPAVGTYTPMLTLSCHYLPRKPISAYADAFVSMLEKYLPAALPVAYGSKDEPEFIFESCGKQHLIEFLQNEPAPVWYSHAPVTHVLISDATRPADDSDELRVSRVAITLPEAVWKYDEWQFALRRVLCSMMQIFGGSFGQIVPSEKIGVAAWWWRGIPRETGYLFAVGEPDRSLIKCDPGAIDMSDDPNFSVFGQDSTPFIPVALVSVHKKKRLGGQVCRDMFTVAADIPLK